MAPPLDGAVRRAERGRDRTAGLSLVFPFLVASGFQQAHAVLCSIAALMLWPFPGGTGIRTNALQPGHPSLYYTLTLPVPRPVLVLTRFAASAAGVFALFGAMLALHVAVLVITGRPVPLAAMALSSVLAALLVICGVAVLGVLLPLWHEGIAVLGVTATVVAVMTKGWQPVIGLVASPAPPWPALAWGAGIVAAALSLATVVAARKDF